MVLIQVICHVFRVKVSDVNDCNTSLGKDAMNRVSTNGLFVAFFFQIGLTLQDTSQRDSVAWI
ncbi:hypothetical protein [Nostoc sp. 'Peltigera membranacea cyanobiont' 210A]|uniref:hypothetical protein n=1 Tax=Nostoc sp. 'Peltigera membranacea cyanobiont' 210A TaxID=2014529 RepID=UPI00117EBE44|nr:hypothetical protein [Nostoc sp. 'Peltigera membranacea cyanobiont' 210A]